MPPCVRFPFRVGGAPVIDRTFGVLGSPPASESLEVPAADFYSLAAAVAGAGKPVPHRSTSAPAGIMRTGTPFQTTFAVQAGGLAKTAVAVKRRDPSS